MQMHLFNKAPTVGEVTMSVSEPKVSEAKWRVRDKTFDIF
jgi:hypothetical protein